MNFSWVSFPVSLFHLTCANTPIAFIIGCLVSFRALFVKRDSSANEAYLQERRRGVVPHNKPGARGLRARIQVLQDELTTTFMSWEATTRVGRDSFHLPHPPTGRMSLDFEQGNMYGELHGSAPERSGTFKAIIPHEIDNPG